jgi:hypothetical protein
MSGGGGGVAIAYMIENAESLDNTLMVNSTPIVIRSLTGVFPQSFRDLTLVAGTIGDFAALVVPPTARLRTWPACWPPTTNRAWISGWRRFRSRRHGPPCRGDGDAGGGRGPDGAELHPL